MKTYCLWLLLLSLCCNLASGKIKNGYAPGAEQAKVSLTTLQGLVNGQALTKTQRRVYDARIKFLIDYITYYELTEELLGQFKTIAPELYNEIDSIKDLRGRFTDVYVRFIPKEQAHVQAWGTTNVSQSGEDMDLYKSEFGEGTVSVTIWIVTKSLLVLAHEFGHVKVQVASLAKYVSYYKETYRPNVADPNLIGHEPKDPSGQSADAYAKRFHILYSNLFKKGNVHPESPYVLQDGIRKRIYESLDADKAIATLQQGLQ